MQWHATTAEADIKWTEDIFTEAFKGAGKPLDQLELKDFVPAVTQTWKKVEKDPRERTFAGIKRGADGRFSDDDLAKCVSRRAGLPIPIRLRLSHNEDNS